MSRLCVTGVCVFSGASLWLRENDICFALFFRNAERIYWLVLTALQGIKRGVGEKQGEGELHREIKHKGVGEARDRGK